WLLAGLLLFYLRYQYYATLRQAALVSLVKVTDLAILIYFANLYLVPRFLYRKKYFLFALFFLLSVAISSFLKLVQMSWVLQDAQLLDGSHIKEKVYNNFVTQFFLVLASIGLKTVVDYFTLQNKLAEMAKQKAEAELNFLKSQINPHFLFNSLNAVYFLIDKTNANARAALHKFSEMLRYQLYECNGDKIPIEKEIDYLRDYVALQQLRVSGNTAIQFDCGFEVSNFSIEPLLLIPFVENSFKHLSHFEKERQNEVKISISRSNGSLHFSVYNTTEHTAIRDKDGGIGLVNVKKRLGLLYPGKHHFSITEKKDWFGIDLTLSLYN
ncbi:MAG: histidine kinase, partial [Gloeobacteraceae cyanobacterium ES-bin-316]|nr:histidine kinase [Ferruginibacter sp.]